jgi:hypothetical protein
MSHKDLEGIVTAREATRGSARNRNYNMEEELTGNVLVCGKRVVFLTIKLFESKDFVRWF